MSQQGFEINITKDSVDVRRDVSFLIQRYGSYVGLAYIALAVAGFYWVVLDSNGRASTWDVLMRYPATDRDFVSAVLCLALVLPLMAAILFMGARTLFPSGELLHCDRSTFTVSRIPWFNLRGKWTTRSYPLPDISQLRFGTIIRSRGNNFDGLRFSAAGKEQKLFAGLEAPEAHKILKGLHALGVDVLEDPEMRDLVKFALEERSMKLDNR
jgi:hypothetical protein